MRVKEIISVKYIKIFVFSILFVSLLFIVGLVLGNNSIQKVYADNTTTPKNPRIEIFPTQGPVNTQIFIRIWDYTAQKTVLVFFGTASSISSSTSAVCYTTTDESGYAVVNFIAGTIPGGRYMIIADDGINRKTTNFMLTPTVTLNDVSGCVGDTISVSGAGFASKKPISVFLDTTKIANGDTDVNGKFTDLKFNLISCACGTHTIKVQDSEGNIVNSDYNVLPKMWSFPSSGQVGSLVTISGNGFPNKDINIYFDEQNIATAKVAANGNFSTNVTVPFCGNGIHNIKADDGLNRCFSEISVSPNIIVSPLTGNVGTQIGIQGFGFQPGLPVTVSYDNKVLDSSPVNTDGSLIFNFKIPKSVHGDHVISVTDSINTLKSTFTMESSPPLPPVLVSPVDSAKIVKDFHFEWNPVADPSGVVYSLEIADDAKFSNILFTQSNLTQCTYDLSETDCENLLVSRTIPYYWRVDATDGASNEGQWSSIGSFFKAFTLDTVVTNMPDWTKLSLIGIGISLVVFMLFLFVRVLKKMRNSEDSTSEPDSEAESDLDSAWNFDSESEEGKNEAG